MLVNNEIGKGVKEEACLNSLKVKITQIIFIASVRTAHLNLSVWVIKPITANAV